MAAVIRALALPDGAVADDASSAAADRAFAALYRDHAAAAFALLTRLVGPAHEREDLLQDTFVRLHRALPRFRGECTLATLVYRITTRVAIDHLRRRRTRVAPEGFDLEEQIDPHATPAEQAQRRDELVRALAVLARLDPELRVAFVLREVMGLSHDEVGDIIGARPAAARMRVAKARRVLARLAHLEEDR